MKFKKTMMLYSGMISFLIFILVLDELVFTSYDYSSFIFVAIWLFGLSAPCQMTENWKSQDRRLYFIKICSLIFTLCLILAVFFLNVTRERRFDWSFVRLLIVILALNAICLKLTILSIRKLNDKRNGALCKTHPTAKVSDL